MPTQIYRWARRHKDLHCDCCVPPKIVVMCPKINSYRPRKQSEAFVDVPRFGLPMDNYIEARIRPRVNPALAMADTLHGLDTKRPATGTGAR